MRSLLIVIREATYVELQGTRFDPATYELQG